MLNHCLRRCSRFLQRYKMLCKKTWPNVRGSDEDGVKAILTEQGLIKDATFGNTKVFIQSPETLFHLVIIVILFRQLFSCRCDAGCRDQSLSSSFDIFLDVNFFNKHKWPTVNV